MKMFNPPYPGEVVRELCLEPFEIDASRLIAELEHQQRAAQDYLFNLDDVLTVFATLSEPSKWETIWVGQKNQHIVPPKEFVLLGYEPNYFVGDHFSLVMDSMFFPTWNGTDEQGQLFLPYFNQLNRDGLFSQAGEAEEFLKFYVQHVPSERIEDFNIIGVYAKTS